MIQFLDWLLIVKEGVMVSNILLLLSVVSVTGSPSLFSIVFAHCILIYMFYSSLSSSHCILIPMFYGSITSGNCIPTIMLYSNVNSTDHSIKTLHIQSLNMKHVTNSKSNI